MFFTLLKYKNYYKADSRSWLFLILLHSICSLQAQDHRPTGLIDEDGVYSTIPQYVPDEGIKYNMLIDNYSLKEYCPMPGDQGSVSSCVAWAIGYGALTMCRAIRDSLTNREAITQKANSANFIFNKTKEGENCSTGSKFSKAFNLLLETGDCLAINFDTTTSCTQKPDTNLVLEANQYKIKGYSRLFNLYDLTERKIKLLKLAIASNNPVVIGMSITSSFYNIRKENALWQPDAEPIIGKHAMVAIGYNDRTREIEIMNSFGTNWGDQGFFRIKYEDFGKMVQYGFQIAFDKNLLVPNWTPNIGFEWDIHSIGKDTSILQGQCNYLVVNDSLSMLYEDLVFKNAAITFDHLKKQYAPVKIWPLGTNFRLQLNHTSESQFIYVFSASGSEDVKLHLPNDTNQKATGTPSNGTTITLPPNHQVFHLDQPGDHNICLLYSTEKIDQFKDYLNRFDLSKGNFRSRVFEAFQLDATTCAQIEYDDSTMYFQRKKKGSKKFITPIFFKITVE